jgi:hypothetical protein
MAPLILLITYCDVIRMGLSSSGGRAQGKEMGNQKPPRFLGGRMVGSAQGAQGAQETQQNTRSRQPDMAIDRGERAEGNRPREVEERTNRRGVHPAVAAIGGVVVGILVMGSAWYVLTSAPSGQANVGASTTAAGGSTSPTVLGTEASAPATPDVLTRCRAVDLAQQAALSEASAALDQWELHVGAMNKLVVGAISLDQATAFWNQTRVGAAHNVHAFHGALTGYRDADVDCPATARLGRSSAVTRACAEAVAARERTIRAAATSISTWDKHVRDMEKLRSGRLSPARATELWLASWRAGVRQLRAYDRVAAESKGRHC